MYLLSYTTLGNTDYWLTYEHLPDAQRAMEVTLQLPEIKSAVISVAIISTEPHHVEEFDSAERLLAIRHALADWRADRESIDFDERWGKIQGALRSLEITLELAQ